MNELISKDDLEKDAALLDPCRTLDARSLQKAAALFCLAAWGLFAALCQFSKGLSVTGLNLYVFWGLYIVNFVFFLGIAYAGTVISVFLRIFKAEWRRPITRAAEVMAVVLVPIAISNIILDLGRPERAFFIMFHAQVFSPLVWDMVSVNLYLGVAGLYLYAPMIPDLAILRDHLGKRQWLYRILALGYQGTPLQKKILKVIMDFKVVIMIPVIFLDTVIAYVFSVTPQPMWRDNLFGPYFVFAALFSGVAGLILILSSVRKFYRLEAYLKPVHFSYLGQLMFAMACLWLLATTTDLITTHYSGVPEKMAIFNSKLSGKYAICFWLMVICCVGFPMFFLSNKRFRTVRGCTITAGAVLIGIWIERFLIIIPTLVRPRLPYPTGFYHPSWVEISLLTAMLSTAALLLLLFSRFFPIISISDTIQGRKYAVEEVSKRVSAYLPDEAKNPI